MSNSSFKRAILSAAESAAVAAKLETKVAIDDAAATIEFYKAPNPPLHA